jgi:hypothetical protein
MKLQDKEWLPVGIGNELWSSLTPLLDGNSIQSCPHCQQSFLGFYYHEWAGLSRREGTIWIWCSNCRIWTHVSRLKLPAHFEYADPFSSVSLTDFGRLEKDNWIERLDQLWKEGSLPKKFTSFKE